MSGDRYLITDQNAPHYLTFTVVDWVDVFTRRCYKDIVVDSLNYCAEHKGLEVYAWCLMSNHLHTILRAREGSALSDIIRDCKKHITASVITAVQTESESRREWMLHRFEWAAKSDKRITNYKFWQESNHAIHLSPHKPEIFKQKLDYIHNNPVRAGIVEHPQDYLYSSARDYSGAKGLVNIILAL